MNEIQKAQNFYNANRARVYVINPRTALYIIVAIAAIITTIVAL